MHKRVPRDMVELRQRLGETWTKFQQNIVDEAIVVFTQRKVTHFEHFL